MNFSGFDLSTLGVAFLAMVAAGGVAYALIYPLLSGDARAEKRLNSFASVAQIDSRAQSAKTRKDQVSQALKDIDEKERGRKKIPLEARIAQAGLTWDKKKYFIVSVICAAVMGVLLLLTTGNMLFLGVGLFIGGLGVPGWYLGWKRNKRLDAFIKEFPNAVDVIVRGLRSGLPLNDCVRIISSEAAEPVRTEFKKVIETQALGLSMPEAIGGLFDRVPVAEANFFVIVIQIQAKSGGNLSEALGNLSKVIRERRKMKMKIQAVSMEAKASAAIIAALPFVVAILVWLTSPKYIEILWLTQAGKLSLACCAVWMSIGVMIMRKMINFDF
jgi:tight adherence protein B